MDLERIQKIATKTLTYNKDINQHIESCRISLKIIDQREDTIKILRDMLANKDAEIRVLEENNLTILTKKNKEINEFKRVIEEQYKLINDLASKINKLK